MQIDRTNLVPPLRRERPGCPQGQVVARWYGDDSPHLSLPNSQPCVGGSKGVRQGNRQDW